MSTRPALRQGRGAAPGREPSRPAPALAWASRPAAGRKIRVIVSALLAALAIAASGCTGHPAAPGASDPAVQRAQAVVAAALKTTGDYRGPPSGPPAQRSGLIVFVAADLTDGGIAGVAQRVDQAAQALRWTLRIFDGQGTVQGQTAALRLALTLKPAGIILGGVIAGGQQATLRQARAQDIPVVGWQAVVWPGPDPSAGLFTNVPTNPQ